MANINTSSFNSKLYDLLRVRGYKPVPLNYKNQRVNASEEADVIEFTFKKDDKDYGKVWVSIDDAQNLIVYYDEEQQNSPDVETPGLDYDDTWTGLLKLLKQWAQRRQMSFELSNKDRLGDDMKQREYYKMKEKLGESKKLEEVGDTMKGKFKLKAVADRARTRKNNRNADWEISARKQKKTMGESYHPMGKKASYNDAIPNVKIVLQHNRALEEGEQRYRNVAKIFVENTEGERILVPTTRPGIARVYARHIAEGGLPNDERWNHIKGLCEEYNKMGGFVRATKNKQFNESVQELVNEGISHYTSLRETLNKLTGHRGYNLYFESWTPTLMENENADDISEMFRHSTVDPRIESAMPILSRLHKNVSETKVVDELATWADDLINETLDIAEDFKNWEFEMEPGDITKVISGDHKGLRGKVVKKHDNGESYSIKDKDGKVTRHHISTLDRPNISEDGKFSELKKVKPWKKIKKEKVEEADNESIKSNNPQGIPEGWDDPSMKMSDDIKIWKDKDELGHGQWFWTRAKNGHIVARGGPCISREEAEQEAGSPKTKFELDEHEDESEDEGFFVCLGSEEKGGFVGMLTKESGRWRESVIAGNAPYNWGNRYMSYLTPDDIMQHMRNDYGRQYDDIAGPFYDEEDAMEHARYQYGMVEISEDLGPEQKRVGQLGPTEKVRNNNIGKLVGANESIDTNELNRIIDIARFSR
jgi:hypothetical protein